jgi:small conductance mechanosensitive channel
MPQLAQFLPAGFWLFTVGQLVLRIAAVIVGAIILKKAIKIGLNQWQANQEGKSARMDTITSLLENASNLVINFLLLLFILSTLGFNIVPLLTGAGVVGLAIGYGAKDIAADFIAGFFILFENRFYVGDTIEVSSAKGEVTEISLRTITIKDEGGNLHIIPNSSISSIKKIK